jgi:hypothetical protein
MTTLDDFRRPLLPVPNKTKRVSFDTLTVVRDTLHIIDFTGEERHAYWFSTEEKAAVRKSIYHALRKMGSGQKIPSCNVRGLEIFSYENVRIRQCIRKRATEAVLGEQERQRKLGFRNQDKISLAYSFHTTQCQEKAHGWGIADKLECEAQYDDLSTKKASSFGRSSSTNDNARLRRLVSPRRLLLLVTDGRQAERHS